MEKSCKHVFALISALVILMTIVSVTVGAEETAQISIDGLTFEIRINANTGDRYTVVMDGTPVKDLVIPAEIDGIPVREIAPGFATISKGWDSTLESLTIEEGVEVIGENAFARCTSLSRVSLPESLVSVGEMAFVNIAAENLHLPESALDASSGFWYCSAIRKDGTGEWEYGLLSDGSAVITSFPLQSDKLIIPDTVDGIPVTVVARVPLEKMDQSRIREIRSVVLPKELRAIEHEAFEYFVSLTKIELPKNLVSVGYAAFKGCKKLAGIKIPGSVVNIGDEAFCDCDRLIFPVLPSGLEKIGRRTFYQCGKLGSVKLPASVRVVDEEAFSRCRITSLSLNEGLEEIGRNAFFSHRLREIVLPASLREIGEAAFFPEDNKTLKTVTFNGIATKPGLGVFGYDDGWNAYYRKTQGKRSDYDTEDRNNWIDYYRDSGTFGQSRLTLICYPGSRADQMYQYNLTKKYLKGTGPAVTAPDDRVLKAGLYTEEDMLYELIVPEGVEELEDYALAGLSTLNKITLPSTLVRIGAHAFESCTGLTEVTVKAKTMSEIGDAAFTGCSQLKRITIPDGITQIGDAAFEGCLNLETVTLPKKGLLRIGDRAFAECRSLASMTLPAGLETIGTEAFYRCGLPKAQVPNSVTSIGKKAFYYSGLKALTLPAEMEEIPDYLCAFSTKLTSLKLPAKTTRIGKGAFLWCPVGSLALPEGLLSIGEQAFAFDKKSAETGRKNSLAKLTSLKLPASLKIIEKDAFAANDALTSLRIPKDSQLEIIGEEAFVLCSRLQGIDLPDSLRKIGSGAFRNCTKMTKVTLGGGVEELGDEVFLFCTGLTSLTASDSIRIIGKDLLKNHGSKLKVTCPESSEFHLYMTKNHPEIPVVFPKKK